MARLSWSITPAHPLVLIGWEGRAGASEQENAEQMVSEWRHIDPVVRACTALIFLCTDPQRDALSRAAEREGIPFFVQVRTWMPPYIPTFGDTRRTWHAETASIAQIREWYAQYPGMVGVQAVELNCYGFSAEERGYMADLIELSADVGGLVSWQEANDGCNLWLEVGMDRELYRCMARHPDVVLPQWEMNVPKSMYLCHDSVMGLWLAGAADNWGLEPQSFYWLETGYTKLNRTPHEFDQGYRRGDVAACPDTLWGQMILLGASSGATVYSIEPLLGVFVNRERTAYADPWRRSIEPLLAWLITERAIPSRRAVADKVRVAYYADFENAAFAERSDVDCYRDDRADDRRGGAHSPRGHGSGMLYAATYGMRHDWEMIPNTGRYYWIPVLPKLTSTDTLLAFPTVVTPNAFPDVAAARAFFDARCPQDGDGRGDAWMVGLVGTVFVSQTHENLDVPERFSVDVPGLPLRVEGEVGAHQYLVVHRRDDGHVALHLGNHPGRESRCVVHRTAAVPAEAGGLRLLSAGDSRAERADVEAIPDGDALAIRVRHGGAVDLVVG